MQESNADGGSMSFSARNWRFLSKGLPIYTHMLNGLGKDLPIDSREFVT